MTDPRLADRSAETTVRSLPLDELDLTVVVDNETDTLSSVDAGVPQLPEIVSLLRRIPPSRRQDGHDCVTVFDHLSVACHGLSVLVRGQVGERRGAVLFDVGPYGRVWLDNAERLGIDLAIVERVFLSHWHWDHSGALPLVLKAVADARRAAGLPAPVVDVHPERPDRRGIQQPSGVFAMLPDEPTFDTIRAAGGTIDVHAEAHLLSDGMFFGSGAIPRRTSYETGLQGHLSFRGSSGTLDPLVMDERFLSAEVRGRGLAVLSACSHAGVVNASLAARDHYPDAPIELVLGGFHLAGAAMESRITATIDDLATLVQPRIVAPGHCTGWRAKAALAVRFAPAGYAPCVVGSRFVLSAGGRG